MTRSLYTLSIFCFFNLFTHAQITINDHLKFSSYFELYYGYDFGQPGNHNRPDFLYNFHRHNEINLNIGLLKLNYEEGRIRSNLGLMAGTYVSRNLSHENEHLQNIYEANIGLKLSSSKNLWLDIGAFPSHLGFESIVGADCWHATRSLLAENSPYYSSGAHLNYTSSNEKWTFGLLALNGWQRITRIEGQQAIGFGHQIKWQPDEQLTINSSSFIGNEYPSEIARLRIFHNFYTEWKNDKGNGFILGVDLGAQQRMNDQNNYDTWYGMLLGGRIAFNQKHALAPRLEFFSDKSGIVINYGAGFENIGFSTNYDYQFSEKVLVRLEFRSFNNNKPIFTQNELPSENNFYLGGTLSFKLMND